MPQVVRMQHPRGNVGSRLSAERVAMAASEGRLAPEVIGWTRTQLAKAGNPTNPVDRAQTLLYALRSQRAYVPDPVDTMMIVAPSEFLAACTGENCIVAGACGTLTAAGAAATASAGMPVAVVAQAFDAGQHIRHVLYAVETAPGVWYYAEPSVEGMAFGAISGAPTREVWYAVPGGRVLCDLAPSCFGAMQGVQAELDRAYGDTIGIGVGQAAMDAPSSRKELSWLEVAGLLAIGATGTLAAWYLGRMVDRG